jgi:hypothetical protein
MRKENALNSALFHKEATVMDKKDPLYILDDGPHFAWLDAVEETSLAEAYAKDPIKQKEQMEEFIRSRGRGPRIIPDAEMKALADAALSMQVK